MIAHYNKVYITQSYRMISYLLLQCRKKTPKGVAVNDLTLGRQWGIGPGCQQSQSQRQHRPAHLELKLLGMLGEVHMGYIHYV